ncbi:hypothetical protein D9615_006303 [Tricholomella constricta]|uniref:F-box domain-containing protein n=1 Tax=Tricholomella constricta TaxID=117010 RepID=A0A8H5M475_9AGAR|nr:hypothetical protein D9615_006303 [Tricholomella constricta]
MLLQLPPEIVVRILYYLDIVDLVSVSCTHSTVYKYTQSFQILQYRFATQAAAVDDNPHCKLIISERLALLKSREEGWARFNIDFRKSISVLHHPSGIYDMTGGIYLLGDESRRTLHYCTLPSKPSDSVAWSQIHVEHTLVDMGLSIYEHDLIAIVTTKPHPTDTSVHIIELNLLQFSTGQPHPRARNPVFFVAETGWPRPAIGIEIVGDNIALITTHFLNPFQPRDRFYIFDWPTATLKMEIHAPNHTYSGLVFLSPTLLLLPNTRTAALDIWAIPDAPAPAPTSTTPPPRPLLSLLLPALAHNHMLVTLSCRGEPSPSPGAGTRFSPQPVHTRPADALLIFNVRVQHLVFGFGLGGAGGGGTFSMFARRGAVLGLCEQLLERNAVGEGASPPLSVAVSPETGTAPVPDVDMDTDMGMGEEEVEEEEEEEEDSDEEMYEDAAADFDFPLTTGLAIVGPSPSPPPAPSAALDHEHERKPLQVPWHAWGPPLTRWMDAADTPTRWITTSAGTRCVLSSELGDAGEENENERVRVLDFNPFVVRRCAAAKAAEAEYGEGAQVVMGTSVLDHGAFEAPIVSALPYVCFAPRRDLALGFDFDGVLMDEERLLGLRTDPQTDRIVEIEVMHIGWPKIETETGAGES